MTDRPAAATKGPRGRPAMAETQRKRSMLTMRVRDELKAELTGCAADNQRSVSEEAEWRLERSVEAQGLLDEAMAIAFGERFTGLAILMTSAAHETATHTATMAGVKSDPFDNPYVFDQMARSVMYVLEVLRPPGKIEIPEGSKRFRHLGGSDEFYLNMGRTFAITLLRSIVARETQHFLLKRFRGRVDNYINSDLKKRIVENLGETSSAGPEGNAQDG